MKSDSLFYRLFREWPGLALELAGLNDPDVGSAAFGSGIVLILL
jgi:hypothetical protein